LTRSTSCSGLSMATALVVRASALLPPRGDGAVGGGYCMPAQSTGGLRPAGCATRGRPPVRIDGHDRTLRPKKGERTPSAGPSPSHSLEVPHRAGRRQVLRSKRDAAARPECAGSRRKTVVLISTSGCTPPVEPTTLRPTNRSTASMSGWRRASSSTCLCCITAPVLPYARSVRSPFVKPPWSTQTTRSSPMYVRALRGPCPMCSLCRRTIEREISQSSSARSGRDEAGCTLPAFVEVGTRPDTDGTIAQ
jgi:hypothetical protein